VGGGSVIDATKFIAAAVLFEGGDAWAILEKRGRNISAGHAVWRRAHAARHGLGNEQRQRHHAPRQGRQAGLQQRAHLPVFSVLDPTKTYTLPPQQLANGVVDAFVHTVEQYLTYPVNAPVQDRFAEGMLQTLIEIGPRLLTGNRARVRRPRQPDVGRHHGAQRPDWCRCAARLGHAHDWSRADGAAQHRPRPHPGHRAARALLNERRVPKRAKLLQYGERVWGITTGS
jgi:NADP-dependent alcohol dehydrogenase